jgi:dTDP-4-dehydrorhamnose 3,5-epimerase
MRFEPLSIPGPWLIAFNRQEDERGFFARIFCADIFLGRGLCASYPQWSVSFNHRRGTVRGLHFQAAPHGEVKLVSCTKGAIFDVAVDIRPQSPTRGRWVGVELSADQGATLYIPDGFAHGYQTLTDGAEVLYHISKPYRPEAARGVRWDDPDIDVRWPAVERRVISPRDQELPRLVDI